MISPELVRRWPIILRSYRQFLGQLPSTGAREKVATDRPGKLKVWARHGRSSDFEVVVETLEFGEWVLDQLVAYERHRRRIHWTRGQGRGRYYKGSERSTRTGTFYGGISEVYYGEHSISGHPVWSVIKEKTGIEV